MKRDGLERLLTFLDHLRTRNITFFLTQYSPEGITVTFTLVGLRAEVQFHVNHIEYSIFRGNEDVSDDEAALLALIRDHRP